jgi:hypothetical protein
LRAGRVRIDAGHFCADLGVGRCGVGHFGDFVRWRAWANRQGGRGGRTMRNAGGPNGGGNRSCSQGRGVSSTQRRARVYEFKQNGPQSQNHRSEAGFRGKQAEDLDVPATTRRRPFPPSRTSRFRKRLPVAAGLK